MSKDKILIIDAYYMMHRSNVLWKPIKHEICIDKYHKDSHMNEIHCSCGSPWDEVKDKCYGEMYSLVFSFFRSLRAVIEQFKPNKCFFVLDGNPKFRYEIFPEYKANRFVKTGSAEYIPSKEDIIKIEKREQFNLEKEIIINLIKLLPITTCIAYDYEADDLVGTLCELMKDEELIVFTNDSDYIQLLQRGYESIKIYSPIKKDFMEAPIYHYVGWKTLAGDKTDNIPKILTPKKALDTINNPSKLQAFLNASQENAFLFKRNRSLIEFKHVPDEEINIFDGQSGFESLKSSFKDMKFESMLTEKYWNNFVNTFNCISL